MQVFKEITPLQEYLDIQIQEGRTIGFVPTMGALHDGHLSLIAFSVADNDLTVASIFVNPKQFNNPDDLKKYPRTLDRDLKELETSGCDIVFFPSGKEMYPEEVHIVYDFGNLDKVMEGKHRPGHFNGVAIVVEHLFKITKPDKAYFGQKDFQQLAIIKALVEIQKMPVDIIPCPIVREADGLAMSSRNIRLTVAQRKAAPGIYRALQGAKSKFNQTSIKEIKDWVDRQIRNIPEMQLEYFEIVDQKSLMPVLTRRQGQTCIACIAVYLGEVRLIDNMFLN